METDWTVWWGIVSTKKNSNATAMFPLPLAAFEQYMLIDDNPEFPPTFFIQFQLK